MGKLWTRSKTVSQSFQQNARSFFLSCNLALCVQFYQAQTRREPKIHIPSDVFWCPLFTSKEREVMLRREIFYCPPGQMGLAGMTFSKTGKSENKRKSEKWGKTNQIWGFCEPDRHPTYYFLPLFFFFCKLLCTSWEVLIASTVCQSEWQELMMGSRVRSNLLCSPLSGTPLPMPNPTDSLACLAHEELKLRRTSQKKFLGSFWLIALIPTWPLPLCAGSNEHTPNKALWKVVPIFNSDGIPKRRGFNSRPN